MELAESVFNAYFKKQMNLEELVEKLGINESDFLEHLLCEMDEVFMSQDALRLEHLIYALYLWNERIGEKNVYGLEKFLDRLNKLLVSDWHHNHEDIVWLLQKISSAKSLEYLYDAIELHPQYLAWDDNFAFEIKCVRAIYYIGKEKSFFYLEKLCKHSNEVIRKMAQRQIKKIIKN